MTGRATPSGLLARLVDQARRQTDRRRRVLDDHEMRRLIAAARPPHDLVASLRHVGATRFPVIAECKRRSPSRGVLATDYRPADRAARYAAGGAAAISVLTHEEGFGGHPRDLADVRDVVELPVLRKDVVIDEFQVDEARALGADAVLLIVAAVDPPDLAALADRVQQHGMTALVEVHDEAEVDIACGIGARIIGVNHRDLTTFRIDPTLTGRLRPRIGSRCPVVAESGVTDRAGAVALRAAGADAVLVGELLMRTGRPEITIDELSRDDDRLDPA